MSVFLPQRSHSTLQSEGNNIHVTSRHQTLKAFFEGVFIAAGEWNTCSLHVSLSAADINLI